MKLLGLVIAMAAIAGLALAQTQPVPEIDGSSIATGIALVSGALLIARSRRK